MSSSPYFSLVPILYLKQALEKILEIQDFAIPLQLTAVVVVTSTVNKHKQQRRRGRVLCLCSILDADMPCTKSRALTLMNELEDELMANIFADICMSSYK
jgi:hypothetical protein